MTTILGYARVSTSDQDVAGQTMRLEQTGAIKVFTDVMSGKSMSRPGLAELLAYARQGDTLAIVRLDRLGPAPGRELLAAWSSISKTAAAASLSPPIRWQHTTSAGCGANSASKNSAGNLHSAPVHRTTRSLP